MKPKGDSEVNLKLLLGNTLLNEFSILPLVQVALIQHILFADGCSCLFPNSVPVNLDSRQAKLKKKKKN